MTNVGVLAAFMEAVWNRGDAAAVDQFVGEQYTIHSDPGDPWDGKTLSRSAFKDRLNQSRGPFPDLHFDVTDTVANGDTVAIAWTMTGTQTGFLGGQPPTHRRFMTHGMTIYYFLDGQLTGHRQVVDRLSVVQQLGLAGPGRA
jgi:steroid delta-isomerase-like uncharacterized protein